MSRSRPRSRRRRRPRCSLPCFLSALPGIPQIAAATNGHLLVAEVRVVLPGASVTRMEAEALARRVANTAFPDWPQLNSAPTVSIIGTFNARLSAHDPHNHVHYGTLFTTTIDRAAWPTAGFAATQLLPGKPFINPRLHVR